MSKYQRSTIRLRKSRAVRRSAVLSAVLSMALVAALLFSLAFTARAHVLGSNTQTEAAPSRLTITLSGQTMTPSSATVSGDIIHLLVELQGEQQQLTLRVSREGGEVVREIVVPEKVKEWATELQLPPGQYQLSEVGNTASSCRITVQAVPKPVVPGGNPQ